MLEHVDDDLRRQHHERVLQHLTRQPARHATRGGHALRGDEDETYAEVHALHDVEPRHGEQLGGVHLFKDVALDLAKVVGDQHEQHGVGVRVDRHGQSHGVGEHDRGVRARRRERQRRVECQLKGRVDQIRGAPVFLRGVHQYVHRVLQRVQHVAVERAAQLIEALQHRAREVQLDDLLPADVVVDHGHVHQFHGGERGYQHEQPQGVAQVLPGVRVEPPRPSLTARSRM